MKLGQLTGIHKYLLLGLLLNTLFIFIFTELAEKLLKNSLTGFDNQITSFIVSFQSPILTNAMIIITLLGSWGTLITIAVLAIIYLMKDKKKIGDAVFLIVALIGGWLVNELLKGTFHRARPNSLRLITVFGYSFPSGHAMMSFTFYGMLIYLIWVNVQSPRIRYLAASFLAVLILAIGVSRVYLGVHYPSDVLSGFAAGGLLLVSSILVFQILKAERQ